MRKLFLFTLGILMFNSVLYAQKTFNLSDKIPFDKSFRKGVLPNGLTYYIKRNTNPKDKASFYIYQNVGAVLETDQQNGLAHFLEHMAFNGTKTFPGNSVTEMLARKGVKFGKEVNAYTGLNETVYNISSVPSKDEKVVDSCLIILRDWSHNLLLDEKEIDAERGVIQEEWRQQYNLGYKIRNQLAGVRYNSSVYSKRDALGSMDVVRTFKHDELRKFYQDWYRTDLQAIGIVGDIDVDLVEKKIKALFADIPEKTNSKLREYVVIADNDKPLYGVARERQLQETKVNFEIRFEYKEDNSLKQLRELNVINFFNTLIANRFKELEAKSGQPFTKATISYGDFVKNYKVFRVTTSVKDANLLTPALTSVFTELDRVVRFGFTDSEIERLKINLLTDAENKYNNSDRTDSEVYCKLIKNAYLEGVSIPDAKFSYEFLKEIIPTISNNDLIEIAKKYQTKKNRVYSISAPANKGIELPSASQMETLIENVQTLKLDPKAEEDFTNEPLIEKLPVAGKIISEKPLGKFGAEEWILSNGVKVIYKKAVYEKENVLLNAVSPGGMSLYDTKALPSVTAAAKFVGGYGLGNFDPITLKKVLTGKTVETNYAITDFNESVFGKSTSKDLETMMQLIYMRFQKPRFDREKFNESIKRYEEEFTPAKRRFPSSKDSLNFIINKDNPRFLKFDEHYVASINFDSIQKIYKDRFNNAADFTFYISGDIDADVLKPLVEQYIGSLPGNQSRENWFARKSYFPKGVNKYRLYLPMSEPKAMQIIKMQADGKYSRENVVYHTILGEILKIRLIDVIREKEGGTYTVGVTSNSVRIPEMKFNLEISFNCDPEKADYLSMLTHKELETLKKEIKQEELDIVVSNLKKNTQNVKETNNYWIFALQNYITYNEDVTSSKYISEILNNVTVKDIKKAAKNFLNTADIADAIIYPKKYNSKK